MIKTRLERHPAVRLGTFTAYGSEEKYLPEYYSQGVVTTHGNYKWQKPTGVCGGTFLLARNEINYGMTSVSINDSPFSYHGMMAASAPALPWPVVIPTGETSMVGAYHKMKPARPVFDFANAAAELRDLPRTIPSMTAGVRKLQNRFTPDIKGAASGYLALQFGWAPLLNDVSKFVKTMTKIDKYVTQLIRDNGKKVRRRTQVANESTSYSEPVAGYNLFHPILPIGWYSSQPEGVRTYTQTDRTWAVASFRYWLPEAPRGVDFSDFIKARAWGMSIRPSVIYNAIPWTWMVDYFSNLGNLVSNLDTGVADSLAADYFYVMRETERLVECNATATMLNNGSYSQHVSATSTSRTVTKSRLLGSPFGNGLEIDTDLSAKQWSILGALGASRW